MGGAAAPRSTTASLSAAAGTRDPGRRVTRESAVADDKRSRGQPAVCSWRGWGGGAVSGHRLALGAGGARSVDTWTWGSWRWGRARRRAPMTSGAAVVVLRGARGSCTGGRGWRQEPTTSGSGAPWGVASLAREGGAALVSAAGCYGCCGGEHFQKKAMLRRTGAALLRLCQKT